MQNSTSGFVYIIHAIGTSRIKIGHSVEPEKRLKELQTGSPYKLRLIESWPGTKADERRAHTCLSQYRQTGEWFDVPPFIRLRIRELIANQAGNCYRHISVKECLLRSLPPARNGAWWEMIPKTYGYKINLRWRDGCRKLVYNFAGLSYRAIEVLLDADEQRGKLLLTGHLLGELFDKNRKDVAAKIIIQRGGNL